MNQATDNLDELLRQRVAALIALGERFPLLASQPNSGGADLLDDLIFVELAYRTAPANALEAYSCLRRWFPTWRELVTAPLEDVAQALQAAGFAQQRAKLIQKLLIRILEDFPEGSLEALRGWDDPAVVAYLTSLPGIGPFAAYHLMLHALGRPVLPAAWPIARLLKRLGILDQHLSLDTLLQATAATLGPGEHQALYHNLVAHAQDICKPRVPRCQQCCLADHCAYYHRTNVDRRFRGTERKSAAPGRTVA